MYKVDEIEMLKENGFVSEVVCNGFDDEIEVYVFGDWMICKSKSEVKNVVRSYNDGCRICWMNRDRYVKGCEFVLNDMCSCGVWICGSVEECLSIIEEENC